MTLFNKINKLIPKQLYSTSRHNVLALVFVLLVLLVVQYPSIFSKSANTVFGKAITLLIIILLTNYNTLIGLAAATVALVFYVYLFDTVYEGAASGMDNSIVKKDEVNDPPKIDGLKSVAATVETSTGPLPTNSELTLKTKTFTETPNESAPSSQSDIMLAAKTATASQDSKALPSPMNASTSNVAPADSTGSAKSTSDATTLKPSPASVTALTATPIPTI